MSGKVVSFDDCPDCHGTGSGMGERDCYLCHGTGQVQDNDDDVRDFILNAPEDALVSEEMDGLINGTHYLDRDGNVRPKST